MTTIDQWLLEVKARIEKATEGPWTIESSRRYRKEIKSVEDWIKLVPDLVSESSQKYVFEANCTDDGGGLLINEKDLNFITHSRTDLPRAIRLIEKYKEALERCDQCHCKIYPEQMAYEALSYDGVEEK